MARPSKHDPITKSYAIDQITDIEHLRAVARRMWEAFFACHAQYAHVLGAITQGDCETCRVAFLNCDTEPCDQYREWQKKITDGFGGV